MKTKTTNKRGVAALTRMEVMVVIAILFCMAAVIMPFGARYHHRTPRVICVFNLKQISSGWLSWANDNGDTFPWNVRFQDGGAMKNDGSGPFDIVRQFLAASNQINSPKIIVCPADSAKHPATNWAEFCIQSTVTHPNISYFYNQDATNNSPHTFLAGDRNLLAATNALIPCGRMGAVSLTLNSSNCSAVDWDQKTIHQGAGNIALEDGSVLQVRSTQVRAQAAIVLKGTTNQMRLIYPRY